MEKYKQPIIHIIRRGLQFGPLLEVDESIKEELRDYLAHRIQIYCFKNNADEKQRAFMFNFFYELFPKDEK